MSNLKTLLRKATPGDLSVSRADNDDGSIDWMLGTPEHGVAIFPGRDNPCAKADAELFVALRDRAGIPEKPEEKPTHVDDFVYDPVFAEDFPNQNYARWVLMHMRLPAHMKASFGRFMKDHRLFCTWSGRRWRVTGASRLGDVWLHEDFAVDVGYQHRIDLAECCDWGPEP